MDGYSQPSGYSVTRTNPYEPTEPGVKSISVAPTSTTFKQPEAKAPVQMSSQFAGQGSTVTPPVMRTTSPSPIQASTTNPSATSQIGSQPTNNPFSGPSQPYTPPVLSSTTPITTTQPAGTTIIRPSQSGTVQPQTVTQTQYGGLPSSSTYTRPSQAGTSQPQQMNPIGGGSSQTTYRPSQSPGPVVTTGPSTGSSVVYTGYTGSSSSYPNYKPGTTASASNYPPQYQYTPSTITTQPSKTATFPTATSTTQYPGTITTATTSTPTPSSTLYRQPNQQTNTYGSQMGVAGATQTQPSLPPGFLGSTSGTPATTTTYQFAPSTQSQQPQSSTYPAQPAQSQTPASQRFLPTTMTMPFQQKDHSPIPTPTSAAATPTRLMTYKRPNELFDAFISTDGQFTPEIKEIIGMSMDNTLNTADILTYSHEILAKTENLPRLAIERNSIDSIHKNIKQEVLNHKQRMNSLLDQLRAKVPSSEVDKSIPLREAVASMQKPTAEKTDVTGKHFMETKDDFCVILDKDITGEPSKKFDERQIARFKKQNLSAIFPQTTNQIVQRNYSPTPTSTIYSQPENLQRPDAYTNSRNELQTSSLNPAQTVPPPPMPRPSQLYRLNESRSPSRLPQDEPEKMSRPPLPQTQPPAQNIPQPPMPRPSQLYRLNEANSPGRQPQLAPVLNTRNDQFQNPPQAQTIPPPPMPRPSQLYRLTSPSPSPPPAAPTIPAPPVARPSQLYRLTPVTTELTPSQPNPSIPPIDLTKSATQSQLATEQSKRRSPMKSYIATGRSQLQDYEPDTYRPNDTFRESDLRRSYVPTSSAV